MISGNYEESELFRIVTCMDWAEFLAGLSRHELLYGPLHGARIVYRGQRCVSWPLRSTWERQFRGPVPQKAGLCQNYEIQDPKRKLFQDHLEAFRSELKKRRLLLSFAQLDDNHLTALARHHGLLTPLLDWTSKSDVAAYFAFDLATDGEGGAAIWALSLDPTREDCPKRGEWVHPSFAARQEAQFGLFTHLGYDEIFSDLAEYLVNHCYRGKHPYLTKFVVPWSEYSVVQQHLTNRGISKEALFLSDDSSVELKELDEIAAACNSNLVRPR